MRKGDWEILDALYRSKNMTYAAKALFMSQPALTKRLQLIEDYFQCQVAVRTNRGISFTPQGEYLCRFAQQYMESVEGVRQTVARMNAVQSNFLKIAAPSSFARYILPKLLQKFHVLHPEIEVRVQVEVSGNISELLSRHAIHAGFSNGVSNPHSLSRVFSVNQGILLYRDPVDLPKLPNIPFISHNRSTITTGLIDSWWNEFFTVPQKIGMEVTDIETCLEMVKSGFGYTIVFLHEILEHWPFYSKPLLHANGTPLERKSYYLHCDEIEHNIPLKLFSDFIDLTVSG